MTPRTQMAVQFVVAFLIAGPGTTLTARWIVKRHRRNQTPENERKKP